MLLPADDKQFAFWTMKRKGMQNIEIAKSLEISRQAVSRALISVNRKIEKILLDMADANSIAVLKVSAEKGILTGRSIPLRCAAFIFISTNHGVQVWYEHEGDCENCEKYTQCIELLWDYAKELGIKIEKTNDPTKMAEELFKKAEEII